MKWLTKSHIKVGRIGCAWLIHRFVDHNPQFVFSDGADLSAEAMRAGAILFHVEGS
ncbi:MAG: chromate resistance protein, partial [Chloroflexi bacterium]